MSMDDRDDLLKEKLDLQNPERVERDRFLDIIAQIESSGGKNFNHPEMQSGIHKGSSAIGRYGLMPNTVKEVVKRAELSGAATDPMRQIASQDPQTMKSLLESDPQLEQQMAHQLAKRVLEKFEDPEMAAFSWNQGTNLTPQQIAERNYQENDYVKKFRKLQQMLQKKS
jgi:hypothetical protein